MPETCIACRLGASMTIPWHTFEPTGDPMVDERDYFQRSSVISPFDQWFVQNICTLLHTSEEIIRDAEPYRNGDGPETYGIYVLVSGDEIVYVGRALAVYERLRVHRRNGKIFERYWCVGGIPYDYLGSVESYYIHRLKPSMNVIGREGMCPRLLRIASQSKQRAA